VRGAVSNVSQLSQSVVLKAMASPDYKADKKRKYDVMKARYDQAKQASGESRPTPKSGRPIPSTPAISSACELKGLNAEAYRLRLLDQYGVGLIATAPTDIRVAFSCLEVEEIEPMFDLMRQCALDMRGDPAAADLSRHAEAFEE
jgi:hypothetical protein